jgi:hypothetical protein
MWSATQLWHRPLVTTLRQGLRTASPQEIVHGVVVISVFILAPLCVWLLQHYAPKRVPMLLVGGTAVAGLALCINTVFNELPAAPQIVKGITEVRAAYDRERPPLLVFVTFNQPLLQGNNPQFSYYFSGIDVNAKRWEHTTQFVQISANSILQLLPKVLSEHPKRDSAMILVEKGRKHLTESSTNNEVSVDALAPMASTLGWQRVVDVRDYAAYQTTVHNKLTAPASPLPQTPHE